MSDWSVYSPDACLMILAIHISGIMLNFMRIAQGLLLNKLIFILPEHF